MEKTKEIPKVKNNGEKETTSKDDMIERLQREIKELEIAYHQKTGALAYMKEIDYCLHLQEKHLLHFIKTCLE